MTVRRGRTGLIGVVLAVTALLGPWVLVAACGDEENPWPETVLSGNPGGGVGGGSEPESDATVPEEATTPDAAADSGFVSCSSVTTNFTCTINPVAAGTCAISTTPVSVCPVAGLLGCCSPSTSSATCYYVGSTDPASSQAGCQAQGTNAVWDTEVPTL